MRNPYLLRCYVRPEGHQVIAVCVDLDLIVKANTLEAAKNELSQAIQSYLESLNEANIKDLFPRPAPLSVQMDYFFVCFLVRLLHVIKNIRSSFDIFFEVATPKAFLVAHCA